MVQKLDLFKPEEYPVFIGNPESSAALCVVWQSLDAVIKYVPLVKEKFAIVGNLRSPFGANIVLYNLARNPHIRTLYLWGPDKLSNTPIGIEGGNTIREFWNKGLDQNHQIVDHSFKFVDEIDLKTAELIRKEVILNDVSTDSKLDTSGLSKVQKEIPYMDKKIFPPFVVKAPDTFPSEKYIYPIRAQKGADAYLSLLTHIWRYGAKQIIDRESEEVKEIRGAVVVVENEDVEHVSLPEWLLAEKALNISQKSLDNYYQTQFSPDLYLKKLAPGITRFDRPRDYSYLYAELIFAHPRPHEIDEAVFTIYKKNSYKAVKEFIYKNAIIPKKGLHKQMKKVDALKLSVRKKIKILLQIAFPPVDQVANVIDRIKRKEEDLDKEIVLWNPWLHSRLESGRPCLNKLSFSVRGKMVDVHVFARSHDIGKAWFFNFYGIAKLLGKIAKETGYKTGYIIIESESAHIYRRDWDIVRDLVERLIDKKDPRMFFDPLADGDPRGNVLIKIIGKTIKLIIMAPKTGYVLSEIEGRSAREIMYKLKHFQYISRVDAGFFIGSELAKAELCMKLGITYKFDNPIALPTGESITS